MQGSLDAPPIILHASRTIPVTSAVAIAAGPLVGHKLGFAFVVIGIVSGGLITVMALLFPARLMLAPGSLALKWGLTSKHWSWDDVSNFRLGHLGTIIFDAVEHIKYEDEPEDAEPTSNLTQGTLGVGWSAEDIELLEAARARWAKTNERSPA